MNHKKISFLLLISLAQLMQSAETNLSEQNIADQSTEADQESIKQEGITTLNLQEGNWFIKRQVLEKTMDLLETINTLFTSILESRMSFLTTRNKVDREFDLFSKNTGFELGDLTQMINSFIEQMQKERNKDQELSLDERSFLDSMERKASTLTAMKDSLSKIADMDAALDDVLLQIEQEINKSHEYQSMALKNFKTIKTILNDQKAEELYLSTKNIFENMQEIQKYINGQLKTYFETNVSQLKAIMQSSTDQLQAFKQEGIDLKKTLEDFINKDALQAQQKEKDEQEVQQKRAKKQPVSPSMSNRILTTITAPFKALKQWWS